MVLILIYNFCSKVKVRIIFSLATRVHPNSNENMYVHINYGTNVIDFT